MSRVRRVVTAHTAEGKAVVQIDEVMVEPTVLRPGQDAFAIWALSSAARSPWSWTRASR